MTAIHFRRQILDAANESPGLPSKRLDEAGECEPIAGQV